MVVSSQFVITFKNDKVLTVDFEKLPQQAIVFKPADPDRELADELNDAPETTVEYESVGDYPSIRAIACERDLQEFQTDTVTIPKTVLDIETKQTKTIKDEHKINRERLPKAKLTLNKDNDQKRQKISEQALKDELIEILANNGELSFEDINKIVDQPRVSLSHTEPLARCT